MKHSKLRRCFIPALPETHLAFVIGTLAPPERRALAQIVETADLLEVDGSTWLLVPADARLLDILATFGTEAEDRENDLCDEPGEDEEIDDEPETDGVPPPGAVKSREAFQAARTNRVGLAYGTFRRVKGTPYFVANSDTEAYRLAHKRRM